MEKERAYHIIDETNKKYKKMYDSGKDKFNSLPYWLRSHANLLDKELKGKIRPNYNQFKRGSIIYVDFGINIGSELSGGHFAIVLNHNDSKKSSTLNVIPLTSKDKKHFLPIDKTVFDNAQNTLQSSLKKVSEEINEKNDSVNILSTERDELLLKTKEKSAKLKDKISNTDLSVPSDYQQAQKDYDEINDMITVIETKIEMVNDLVSEIKREKEAIEKVFLKYSTYNKNTFACYKALQNISKLRVKKINKYDPSGDIKVDNNTLDKIDEKIISEYTNKKC
ncbi:type II toxin-antitoxin system PemK/MazF family toxin [Staphylococcus saprophyticus]|uniref:type II toxin-antitoxin system PemK/MazF family toxin n=1 Tax=Staphylococcus TaxID=1279 RepID=UPI00194E9BC5|nr:type II toxin-antitoxin system PemK/MazF family toxin [Staphylococcus sp. GFQ9D221P]MDW4166516.1 type II toxin-antitoxin system PemK/MazF family toxin [Staphylococcus saprophyticus]MDW4210813.1 type II toxin-antitoxin system PemK/MazF family toxin [Staphylococcus saprophyticus]MDW4302037.1 type II toxin-antitoxin system PemK/MazF family toxin [Staphylococcus saprophyticus]MDW4356995.1 type II toxin-antitoxin system PemK/MazF family toxin [Staphylococcus saprophyticus]MDW4460294.1 type II to